MVATRTPPEPRAIKSIQLSRTIQNTREQKKTGYNRSQLRWSSGKGTDVPSSTNQSPQLAAFIPFIFFFFFQFFRNWFSSSSLFKHGWRSTKTYLHRITPSSKVKYSHIALLFPHVGNLGTIRMYASATTYITYKCTSVHAILYAGLGLFRDQNLRHGGTDKWIKVLTKLHAPSSNYWTS